MEESAGHPETAVKPDHSEPVLTLTPEAAQRAKAAMQREGLTDHALRVAVVGGGCSGFQYSLSFEREPNPQDTVLEQNGVRMLVDETSLQYLSGTIIDYVTGLNGAGFRFINPKATRTCGCGTSFSA